MPRSRRRSRDATGRRTGNRRSGATAPEPVLSEPPVVPSPATRNLWFLPALSERATVVILILTATLLRLAIAPWGRYWEDSQVLAFRAERLARLPMNELYLTDRGVIGHLPGDLWFLWYVSNFYRAVSPNGDFYGDTFLYLTKLVPILADGGAALALYLLARGFAGHKAGLVAAALYGFNPAPIFIAAVWDQWDALSTCFALFALWLFLRGRYELAAAALTYAALVKPQFAIFGLLFAIVYFRRLILPPLLERQQTDTLRTTLRALTVPLARAGGAILAAWVTAEAILVPFNVSIPPLSAQFDLRDRLDYAFRVHDETTLNAFNFWATPWAGNAVKDHELSFAGLSARAWGQVLFGSALVAILALWWRRGTDRALVWAALTMTFAAFMLPTRIHERYLLPTLALAVLIAAIQPRLLWYCVALTFTFSANVIAVYWMAHDQRGAPFFSRHDPWMTIMAFANIFLFAWILVRGLPVLEAELTSTRRRGAVRRGKLSRASW